MRDKVECDCFNENESLRFGFVKFGVCLKVKYFLYDNQKVKMFRVLVVCPNKNNATKNIKS